MNMYICYSGKSCIFNLNILLSLIYFFFSHNTFYITNKCMNAGKFRSRMWPEIISWNPEPDTAMKSVNVKRNNVYYMSRPALPTKQQTPSS